MMLIRAVLSLPIVLSAASPGLAQTAPPPPPAAPSSAAAPPAAPVSAPAPPGLCDAFAHQLDGSWVALRAVDVPSPDGSSVATVNTRSVWPEGITMGDVPVAAVLDKACAR